MFIFFPIGRKTELTKFPWLTLGLIAVNIIVFILVWPREKQFMRDRVSHEEFKEITHQIIEIVNNKDSGLPEHIKAQLSSATTSEEFPTPVVHEIFSEIEHRNILISPKTKYRWDLIYPRYAAFKISLKDESKSHFSIYYNYSFSKDSRIFPNIITYQFLHAGILHILFNMIFLWLVGCNVEDRWGPILFTLIYLIGGIAAAATQITMYPDDNIPMVGASGSVAAIMGAFLIRHAAIKIRFWYFFMFFALFRSGTFYMPAWVAVPLWFSQQLLMGLMTLKTAPSIGYWAHIGGFMFGAASGIGIKIFNLGHTWEQQADQTLIACDHKLRKAFHELRFNSYIEAEKIFKEVLELYPDHRKARQGIMRLYEQKQDYTEFCRHGIALIQSGIKLNDIILIDETLHQIKHASQITKLNDFLLFQLASIYERIKRWQEAVQTYNRIIKDYASGQYMPKALFSAGRILYEKLDHKDEAKTYFEKLNNPPYDMEWSANVHKYL
ncbi:MAG: rhomboid family intramembrane serine protease [bacterium]